MLIDLDDIWATNVNRQIHALSGSIGQAKVDAMKSRCELINPECKVTVIDDFITLENIREHIQGFDYVIDCIDAVKEKAALIAHCKRNKMPIITTGGAGGQTDPSQITFGDVAKTTQDPLLAKVRYILRKQYNFSNNPKRKFNIDCVYSTEQLVYPRLYVLKLRRPNFLHRLFPLHKNGLVVASQIVGYRIGVWSRQNEYLLLFRSFTNPVATAIAMLEILDD